MKKLIWALLVIAIAVGLVVATQKRGERSGAVSGSESRSRRAMPARPHLPSTDVKETLDEALEEAAGEVAPSN